MIRSPRRCSGLSVAGICALAATLYLPAVLAGDEDISPSAYQEFDPVTGFMVTIDPDAEHDRESSKNSADHESNDTEDDRDRSLGNANGALYLLIVVAAGVAIAVWMRRRAKKNSPL